MEAGKEHPLYLRAIVAVGGVVFIIGGFTLLSRLSPCERDVGTVGGIGLLLVLAGVALIPTAMVIGRNVRAWRWGVAILVGAVLLIVLGLPAVMSTMCY